MKIIPNSRILRAGFILLSALFIFSCSTLKWESTATDDRQMLSDISFLASNKLKGRTFGSPGEVKAGDYIAGRFQQLGLQPKGENGTWFQAFAVKNPNPHTVEFSKTVTPQDCMEEM
ncbi:MAG: hypothetical protein IPP15_05405 [Saprospiraceae bacterium]|uniref:Lipoprotein n=1 Tax=Candidatus Opimibacter skivensis TaxID=2982028 RepID=A0A9D7XSM1_9BACT|nr:hypothetical protein [Candidatus Opimibacter skivensis]